LLWFSLCITVRNKEAIATLLICGYCIFNAVRILLFDEFFASVCVAAIYWTYVA